MKEPIEHPPALRPRREPLIVAVFSILTVALLFLMARTPAYLHADSWTVAAGGAGVLRPLLHFESNAYLLWPSPFQAILPAGPAGTVLYLGVLLFALGFAAASLLPRRELAIFAVGASLVASFGCDVIVFSSSVLFVVAVALFRVAHFELRPRGCYLAGICFGLAALALVASAAFVVLMLAMLTAGALKDGSEGQQLKIRTAALAVAFLGLQLLPAVTFPDYPASSHLVAGYGVVEGLQPLLGTEPPVLVIDRTAIREQLTSVVPLLLCSAFAVFALTRFRRLHAPHFAAVGFLLAVALLFESTLVPISVSQIAPIQSFSRIVPEQVYLPLVAIVTGSAVLSIVLGAALVLPAQLGWAPLVGVVATLLIVRERPIFHAGGERGAAKELVLAELSTHLERPRLESLVLTPSFAVVQRFGLNEALARIETAKRATPLPLPAHAQVIASTRDDLVPLLRDGDPATRWSAGVGKQDRGQWLALRFVEPISVAGVRLASGPFYTDFPRGLEIRTAVNCDLPARIATQGELIAKEDPWEGPVGASPLGFPLLGSQYDVTVAFSKPLLTACLVVVQTGSTPSFDWSVSELGLLGVQ